MSLQIEALSPIMWTIIIAVALVLIAAVVFTWKSSAMSTRKMVTIAMLTAVYVVLNFAGTVRLGWINISVASLPVIVGAMLYGPVGGLGRAHTDLGPLDPGPIGSAGQAGQR